MTGDPSTKHATLPSSSPEAWEPLLRWARLAGRPLEWVVNDGLMVIFLFVVGMEIRRGFHHGKLSEWRRAALPAGMAMRHVIVLGVVAGVGFTMALFIAQLAFTNARLLAAAKLGVLAASGGAAVLALVLGRWLLAQGATPSTAKTADEAEGSTEA